MNSPLSIILVRRYGPDWSALAERHRAGDTINPAEYLPPTTAPAFPSNLAAMIDAWNARFAISYFAFRAALADISARSARAVRGAVALDAYDPDELLRMTGSGDGLLFFHDDDDVFSPALAEVLPTLAADTDAVVGPCYSVKMPSETFAPADRIPSVVIGALTIRQSFHARYMSNNTGIRFSRLRTDRDIAVMRYHLTATWSAEPRGFRDIAFAEPISATIKSPASATMLARVVSPFHPRSVTPDRFADTAESVCTLLPSSWDWLRQPLADIARLCRSLDRPIA